MFNIREVIDEKYFCSGRWVGFFIFMSASKADVALTPCDKGAKVGDLFDVKSEKKHLEELGFFVRVISALPKNAPQVKVAAPGAPGAECKLIVLSGKITEVRQ